MLNDDLQQKWEAALKAVKDFNAACDEYKSSCEFSATELHEALQIAKEVCHYTTELAIAANDLRYSWSASTLECEHPNGGSYG